MLYFLTQSHISTDIYTYGKEKKIKEEDDKTSSTNDKKIM